MSFFHNVKGEEVSGKLQFQNTASGVALLTLNPNRPNELDEYMAFGHIAAANSSGQTYIPISHSGTVVNIQVVGDITTSATLGFTAFVSSTSAITHAALTLTSGGTAGTVRAVAPTAANAVNEGQAVLVRSNGATTAAQVVRVALTIRRG